MYNILQNKSRWLQKLKCFCCWKGIKVFIHILVLKVWDNPIMIMEALCIIKQIECETKCLSTSFIWKYVWL